MSLGGLGSMFYKAEALGSIASDKGKDLDRQQHITFQSVFLSTRCWP